MEVSTQKLVVIPIDRLKEDPLNQEAFSDGDLSGLVEDMKGDGFFGDIAAYPDGLGNYIIESGHRRKKAAEAAGYTELPVLITEPPKTEIERRLRLTQWNLNGRHYGPLDIAKLVTFTYDTQTLRKEKGEISGSLIESTAKELRISTSLVTKYKALWSLVPELRKYAETDSVSWAVLASASSLPESLQRTLATRLSGIDKLGLLTTEKLQYEITHVKRFRLYGYSNGEYYSESQSGPEDEKNQKPSEKEKRKRRQDGAKAAVNALKSLKIASDPDSLIKEEDVENVIKVLDNITDIASDLANTLRKKMS